eukprot:g8764.t1
MGSEQHEYDIVVIGAGLHSLMFLCTFLEDDTMPAHLIDAKRGVVRSKLSERQMRKLHRKRSAKSKSAIWKNHRIAVIDKFGMWLKNWSRQFEVLGIETLRSNAGLHPDPIDPEMLFEFARMEGLTTEEAFTEMTDTKRGKEFVGPFQRPKSKLFNRFCQFLIDSYKLRDVVIPHEVTSVLSLNDNQSWFQLELSNGSSITSRVVVAAMGHCNLRNYPPWVDLDQYPQKTLFHAWDLVHEEIQEGSLSGKTVLVVGGGLTSLQLVNLAIQCGCELAHLISRRPLHVRQFDSDLSWSGHLRFQKLSEFWNEPNLSKRFELIKEARNGGTITSTAFDELLEHQSSLKCTVHEEVEIWDAEWSGETQSFTVDLSSGDQLEADQIWLATGSLVNIEQEKLFDSIREECGLEVFQGYPVLDQDLRWNPKLDLFFIGAYASLALGPDGVNLAGARRGAFRIKEALQNTYFNRDEVSWQIQYVLTSIMITFIVSMQVLLLSNPCLLYFGSFTKWRHISYGCTSVLQGGKIRISGYRRHKLHSSVIEPIVIPPEYENDSTRGKGRPVVDVDSNPLSKFTRWIKRLFTGRLVPAVLFVCCLAVLSAFYHNSVQNQLEGHPAMTISVWRNAEEKQISPYVQVHIDRSSGLSRKVSGILWNKESGTVITKYRFIKDMNSMSLLDPDRGKLDLSVIAVDEKKDVAILELSQDLHENSEEDPEAMESDDAYVDSDNEEWAYESVNTSLILEELDKDRALSHFMRGVSRNEINALLQRRNG